jgi:uncharacterized linocin/CFP29 family protein
MLVDFILNEEGHGPVGQALAECRLDPGLYRPFINNQGHKCVTVQTGRLVRDNKTGQNVPEYRTCRVRDLQDRDINNPVMANAAGMLKDQWTYLDRVVMEAYRERLSAWSDLVRSSSLSGFNAMAKTTIEYQSVNDPGEAVVDMWGISDGRRDAPLFKLRSTPLPITHSDFWFSLREIMQSRQGQYPLDTTMAEFAARRIAETVEDTTIGLVTGMTYGTNTNEHDGTSTIWGYTNCPARILKTDLTTPTGSNPEAVNQDIIEMIELMESNKFYGPYMLYHSTAYTKWLNSDYFRSGATTGMATTTRQRILQNSGIRDIRRLDRLTSGYQLILVQMDSQTARAINAMEPTLIQWESQGGLRQNFKVIAIQVPQIRWDYNGTAAIVHGTTS